MTKKINFGDAVPTQDTGIAFVTSQLEHIESEVFNVEYGAITYNELIPVDTAIPAHVDTVSYLSFDAVTMGKFIAASGQDLPRSDIDGQKSTINIGYAGNSFAYSLEELRKSQALRMGLDTARAQSCREGCEEHIQQVALFGDVKHGMNGLFNHPNVGVSNNPNDWATATGQEIVDDLGTFIDSIVIATRGRKKPNTLIMPSAQYLQISNQRMDSGTDTTIMGFFKAAHMAKFGTAIDVRSDFNLDDAGVASAPRMVAYEKNPRNLTMKMPMPYQQLAPQPMGLEFVINAEYKFSGVEFRYPQSAAYRDFI